MLRMNLKFKVAVLQSIKNANELILTKLSHFEVELKNSIKKIVIIKVS